MNSVISGGVLCSGFPLFVGFEGKPKRERVVDLAVSPQNDPRPFRISSAAVAASEPSGPSERRRWPSSTSGSTPCCWAPAVPWKCAMGGEGRWGVGGGGGWGVGVGGGGWEVGRGRWGVGGGGGEWGSMAFLFWGTSRFGWFEITKGTRLRFLRLCSAKPRSEAPGSQAIRVKGWEFEFVGWRIHCR